MFTSLHGCVCEGGPVAAPSYLQADGQVDPAAERRADRSGVEAEVFEELGEGVCERHPGPLLRHHHAGPNAGQIQTTSLQQRTPRHTTAPSSSHLISPPPHQKLVPLFSGAQVSRAYFELIFLDLVRIIFVSWFQLLHHNFWLRHFWCVFS